MEVDLIKQHHILRETVSVLSIIFSLQRKETDLGLDS